MAGLLFLVGLVILLIGCLFRTQGRATEKRLGVPVRKICAADVGVEVPLTDSEVHKTLVSHEHQTRGGPDYIVGEREEFVPIEVKSAHVWEPRNSDVYQVLTQCFLSEEEGRSVKRGRLLYANNRRFDIPYGPYERQKVLHVLAAIRKAEKLSLKDIPGKHDRRCTGCVYRTFCEAPGTKVRNSSPLPRSPSLS